MFGYSHADFVSCTSSGGAHAAQLYILLAVPNTESSSNIAAWWKFVVSAFVVLLAYVCMYAYV